MSSTNTVTPAQDTTNAAVANEVVAPVVAAASTPEVTQAQAVTPPTVDVKPTEVELKLPEGSLLSPEALDQIKSYAKEKNLSAEVAQDLLMRENAAVESFNTRQMQKFEQSKTAWAEAAKNDSEIGGEAFPKNVELAKRAFDAFATPEFRKEIEATGYGNHPEVIKIFARIGKKMADDRLVNPGAQAQDQKTYEDIFYGKQT